MRQSERARASPYRHQRSRPHQATKRRNRDSTCDQARASSAAGIWLLSSLAKLAAHAYAVHVHEFIREHAQVNRTAVGESHCLHESSCMYMYKLKSSNIRSSWRCMCIHCIEVNFTVQRELRVLPVCTAYCALGKGEVHSQPFATIACVTVQALRRIAGREIVAAS